MINSILLKRGEHDKRGNQITIHYTTVNNYLKEYFRRPRKIRKIFYLSEKQKKKIFDFCESILKKKLKPEQIFFTDESKVELGSFTRNSIRLDPGKIRKIDNNGLGYKLSWTWKAYFFGGNDESIFLWVNPIILQRCY